MKAVSYTIDNKPKTLWSVFSTMLNGLLGSNYVAYRLFRKELLAKFVRARLGVVWDFMEPLSLAMVFVFLNIVGVVKGGDSGLSYATYVTYGILLYQGYYEAVQFSLSTLLRHKILITHQAVAPEALLLANFYNFLFYGAIRSIIIFFVSVFQSEISYVGFGCYILLYPSILIAGMALGVTLAPFDALFKDIGRGVMITLNVMRFATPVMWTFSRPQYDWLYQINPVATILDSMRAVATTGVFPYPKEFCIMLSISFVVLLVGWYLFHVAVVVLAEKA